MFKQMTLGNKILAGFIMVTCIAALMGVVGYWGLHDVTSEMNEIGDNRLPSVQSLLIMKEAQYSILAGERGLINRKMMDPAVRKAQYDHTELSWKQAEDAWKVYEPLPQTKEEAVLWKDFVPKWEAWKKSSQQVVNISREKDNLIASGADLQGKRIEAIDNKAFEASLASRKNFLAVETSLGKLVDLNIKLGQQAQKAGHHKARQAQILLVGALIAAILLSLFTGFYLKRNVASILKGLLDEANRLTEAAVAGKLATRGNVETINFEFRGIVEGVNQTLDAVIGPLNVAAEYVDRISKGDIPPRIADNYNGDFNEIKNNLNGCIDAVNALVADANMLSDAAVAGKLATRANAAKHQGDFQKVVEGVNQTLDAVIGPLNVAAEYVDRISKGDIPPRITDSYSGDFNEIKNNLNGCIDAVNALVADANMLSDAAVAGKLDTRANAANHHGDFQKIVEGVNQTLDAVIGPLNVAAEYVDRISKGDIPPRITDSYSGDFNEIKNNLNGCIDAVNALVADANMLSEAAVAGKLATRANAARHQGDFQKVVEGVNQTLDAVIGPLNVAAEYVDRISKGDIPPRITDSYSGDFNEIKNNLNGCIDAVNALVADANMLSEAAVAGKLATRANAARHQGDFQKVVEGVNQTLDAVIGPLNVAAEYVDRISKGDIPPPISDNYSGDFNEIKSNLNSLITALDTVTDVAEKVASGDLEVEITPRSAQDQLMLALKGMVAQLKELARSAEQIAAGDLTVTVKPASERDVMGNAFVTMVNNLREIVSHVSAGSDSIATASHQIATGNANMAQRTEEQASSLEETASSMEEMTSTVKQNAENAQQANQLAIDASQVAVKGGQ